MYQKIYFINKSNKTWLSRNIENIRTKKRLITIILGNDLQLKIFQLHSQILRTWRMYGSNLSLKTSHPFVNIHILALIIYPKICCYESTPTMNRCTVGEKCKKKKTHDNRYLASSRPGSLSPASSPSCAAPPPSDGSAASCSYHPMAGAANCADGER